MEEFFINAFIKKEKQERLRFELQSKKRELAIDRFAHQAESLLRMDKVLLSGKDFQEEGVRRQFANDRIKEVYVLSVYPSQDKKMMNSNEAFEVFFNSYTPMILIGDGFTLVKTEELGTGYFLVDKDKFEMV